MKNTISPRILIGALLVLTLGFLLGLYVSFAGFVSRDANFVERSELPLPMSVLQNPAIYEWWGAVEGYVIAKQGDVFTVEDEAGNLIEVYNWGSTTQFVAQFGNERIPYAQVPVGAHVRGSVIATPVGSLPHSGAVGDIVGSVFYIVDEGIETVSREE